MSGDFRGRRAMERAIMGHHDREVAYARRLRAIKAALAVDLCPVCDDQLTVEQLDDDDQSHWDSRFSQRVHAACCGHCQTHRGGPT